MKMHAVQALVAELKAAQEWLPNAEEQLPVDAAVAKARAETRLAADKLAAAEAQCQHLQAVGAANEILLKRLEVSTLLDGQLRPLLPASCQKVPRFVHDILPHPRSLMHMVALLC